MNEILAKLYANIGEKIKKLAMSCFVIEAISIILFCVFASIYGIVSALSGENEALGLYLLYPFAGIVAIAVSLVSTWGLYAFGELVQNSTDLRNRMFDLPITPQNTPNESDINQSPLLRLKERLLIIIPLCIIAFVTFCMLIQIFG